MEALGTLGRRLLAWAVLALAAVIVLRLLLGVVAGILQTVMFVVLLLVVGAALLWALRRA